MLWVLLSLFSAVIWSLSNIIDKHIMDKHFQDPMTTTIISGIVGFIIGIIVIIFTGFKIPSINSLLIISFSGLCYIIATFLYFKSIIKEEISRVIPLWSISPLFILILAAIFLGETFTPIKYLGIFFIVISSFLISVRKDFKFKLSDSLFLMTISSLLYSVFYIALKYVMKEIDFWQTFFWFRTTQFIVVLFFLYFYRKKFLNIIRKNTKGLKYSVISEGFGVIGTLTSTMAISIGFVSLVGALVETQPIFVFIWATLITIFKPHIIKEELKKEVIFQKILSIILAFIGVILIA